MSHAHDHRLVYQAPRGERACVCLKPDSFIFILLFYCRSVDLCKLILLSIRAPHPNVMKTLCTPVKDNRQVKEVLLQ